MPILSLRVGAIASFAVLLLSGCAVDGGTSSGAGKKAVDPPETLNVAQQAVGTPCTKDLQGLGAIGGGWFGIRTDGSVWLPDTDHNPIGAASERVNSLGTDNQALADLDGEALHNCVLKTNGDIYCWGMNPHGQLGGGFVSPSESVPVKVVGLPSPAKQVAVGIDSSCALLTNGDMWCWGSQEYGQLGNGVVMMSDSLAPVQVPLSNIDVISVGYWHTCALKAGTVSCWGDNLYGEVGNGSTAGGTVPTPTVVRSGVTQLSAGGFYTCTVQTDHSLWCWGDNFWGQLGLNDQTGRYSPTQVTAVGNAVTYVDTAVHATCVVVGGGVVQCWGSEDAGRLGNGLNNPLNPSGVQPFPGPVSGPLGTTGGAVQLREAEGAGCALMANGHVFCWGGGGFLDGQGQTNVPVEVDFCSLPTLDAISPNFGIYTGGTVVTLTGTEFKSGATVDIGNQTAIPTTVTSPTTLTFTTPNYTFTDTVDVVVNNPDGHHARLLQAFSFTAPPTVAQVVPDTGSSNGGDMVTITGDSFLDATIFDFDGVPATNVIVTDPSTATVLTPAHATGTVDVTATNPGGLTFTLAMGFTYVSPITITSLTPDAGPTAGGTNVTIVGDGFDFNTTVQFDGAPATTVVIQDAQTILATTPMHVAGAVDVTVTRADNGTFTLPGAYNYGGIPSGSGGGGGGGNGVRPGPGNGCYCSAAFQETGRSESSDGSLAFGLAFVGLGFSVMRRRGRSARSLSK